MRSAVRSTICAALLGAAASMAGCSTKPVTTLDASWAAPELSKAPIKKLLIITVASNEFVQIAVQDQMAAQLKARGVNAYPVGVCVPASVSVLVLSGPALVHTAVSPNTPDGDRA